MLTVPAVLDIKVDTVTNFLVGYNIFPPLLHRANILMMWLEFDFRVLGDGQSASARYANNSNYRNDSLIRKESASAENPSMSDFG